MLLHSYCAACQALLCGGVLASYYYYYYLCIMLEYKWRVSIKLSYCYMMILPYNTQATKNVFKLRVWKRGFNAIVTTRRNC